MLPQQYCLRWRYHHSNLQTMFSQLLEREAFCDVTLACEGRTIKAHKIVLSACSTYFETLLSQYEEKDPILIMKDVKFVDIRCLVEFMYKGEINVDHCHLATLLKTAEELKIKGLAEVSWRDENDQQQSDQDPDSKSGASNSKTSENNNVQTTTGMDPETMERFSNNRRKRGRPPIDDCGDGPPSVGQQPPVIHSTNNLSSAKRYYIRDKSEDDEEETNNGAGGGGGGGSGEDFIPWDEAATPACHLNDSTTDGGGVCVKQEAISPEYGGGGGGSGGGGDGSSSRGGSIKSGGNNNVGNFSGTFLTPAVENEWLDVVKMNDYLSRGRRQQFWEEPFTKRVMDAIKTKNLEMKVAAELLGVSYGTLYGRYRDSYGCLKHPYRVRDFWSEQGPTDVLLKLKRKEISLYRAAEQLNVTPQTLSNYLVTMSQMEPNDGTVVQSNYEDDDEEDDDDGDDSMDHNDLVIDEFQPQQYHNNHYNNNKNNSKSSSSSSSSNNNSNPNTSSKSVLANRPDITIIKKEKQTTTTHFETHPSSNNEHSDNITTNDQK